MSSIENRIVQMQFDNVAFERRMSETLRSLEKMDSTLATVGSRNGLEQLSNSVRGFNLGPVSAAIDGVSAKFLALSTVAITVLSNITNRAVDAGIQLAKSLSLDQVISGFKEYELQIGSIQTILANTSADGTTLSQVSAALDELNEYSDKTIYNFAEMTRNIGTFTAAGVDLDLSVQSIKGIANLAAISGSTSQQASTAMYQLSQAISTGTVRLMDWNSVVNAGMGGEVFQRALFETGKMMGTIADTPMDTTFEEWTAAGNSFRGSLESGWLTADVLTTTLQGFTGELTEAQIMSMGYTQEQAAEIMRLGQLGVDSATKVRTLSQLIQTTKEALSSGWAQSFRTIFGDFNEATSLFTGLSDSIGGFIKRNADARNQLLEGWANLGGREALFASLRNVLEPINEIVFQLKEAFRDIFPPMTAQRLMELTTSFRDWTQSLRLGEDTMTNLRNAFRGFFAALEIGWTVLKEGAGFVKDLFVQLTGAGSGKFMEFAGNIGNFFTELNKSLVDGGGIKRFFDDLTSGSQRLVDFLLALKDVVVEFFKSFGSGSADAASSAIDRLKERFESLGGIFDKIGDFWAPFKERLGEVGIHLDEAWEGIKTWFSELGSKIAAIFGPEEFNAVLDTFNVGFLGAIAVLLKKFLDNGLNLNLGGNFFEGVTQTLSDLSGVLQAMQTDIKANALLKIAGAMGVLTVSLMLLATMDSAALSRAFVAMGTGFGILITAFKSLNVLIVGPGSAAKLAILATGLVVLSGAMLILSAAVKTMGSMDWNELTKGLLGVGVGLTMMSLVAGPLGAAAPGLIRAGIGISAIGVGMVILSGAVALFGSMDMDTIGKGLYSVAAALVLIGVSTRLMPVGLPAMGVGLILIATSLNILAAAVKRFSDMTWDQIGQGLFSVAGGLVLIAAGLRLMPPTMVATGVGLLLVATALNIVAKAVQSFGSMSWSEIGKGLITMAGALLLLAGALKLMSGTIGGAVALGVASVALMSLSKVVKELGKLKISELVTGLLGMAAMFAVIGGAAALLSPIVPILAALGGALLLLGGAFALFGIGAAGFGVAIEKVASIGKTGLEVLIDVMDVIIDKIPALLTAFAEGLIGIAQVFAESGPILVETLVVLIESLAEAVTIAAPAIIEAVGVLISSLLQLIRDKVPEFIETGLSILLAFLQGIRDNIFEVTTLVVEIVTQFIDAFAAQVPTIVESLIGLISTILTSVAHGAGELAPTLMIGVGTAFIDGFWEGMKAAVSKLWETVTGIIQDVINWFKSGFGIFSPSRVMMGLGRNVIEGLIRGIVEAAVALADWFIALPGRVLGWIGDVLSLLTGKGNQLITGLFTGILTKAMDVMNWFLTLAGKVLGWIGDLGSTLLSVGMRLISGMLAGIVLGALSLVSWLGSLGSKIIGWVGDLSGILVSIGKSIINGLWEGMKSVWGNVTGWLGGLGSKIISLKGPPKKDAVLLVGVGELIFQGLQKGMSDEWNNVADWLSKIDPSEAMDKNLTANMSRIVGKIASELNTLEMLSPTITPVLDLSRIQSDSRILSGLLPTTSLSQASLIAATRSEIADGQNGSGVSQVHFEQNIFAPEQLSVGEIYRQTRNQIAVAKEELSIP